MLRSILACVLALRLVSVISAGQPSDISFVATHDQTEQRYGVVLPDAYLDFQEARGHETDYDAALSAYAFVMRALTSKPVRVSVAINGRTIPPAPGSAAGVWFYADGETGAQVLLTGHAAVPGSWRMTAALNAGDEVRVSFAPHGARPVEHPVSSRAVVSGRLALPGGDQRAGHQGRLQSRGGAPHAVRLSGRPGLLRPRTPPVLARPGGGLPRSAPGDRRRPGRVGLADAGRDPDSP